MEYEDAFAFTQNEISQLKAFALGIR